MPIGYQKQLETAQRALSEPERQKMVENLLILQAANAELIKDNTRLKGDNPEDMTVNVILTNSRGQSVQINPIGSMSVQETFGNRSSFSGDEPFRLTPKDSETVISPIVIAPHDSQTFKFRMARDNRLVFERGAAVLNCTVFDYSMMQGVTQKIPFNQQELNKTNTLFKF